MAGPRCLVFGGSGTLGRAVCERLSKDGATIAFTYHSGRAAAEELRAKLSEVRALRLDLAGGEGIGRAVREAADALGGVDAFVHCAAQGSARNGAQALEDFPRAGDIDVVEWDRVMAVNVRSVFLAIPAVVEAMAERGGNIVLVGSIDGIKAVPAPVHYAASKGALVAMARVLAKELGQAGIRVNLVAPGVMEGGLSRSLPARHREEYLKHCGLERLATPGEIAELVAWLALENTYLNGECLVADGGL